MKKTLLGMVMAMLVVVGAVFIGSISVVLWREFIAPRATAPQVIEASVEAGFTRDQAIFLRHGPLSSVTVCKSTGLSELTCNFLAYGVEHRHSDKDYYIDCGLSELTRKQCVLLREGVAGYRRTFAGN